MRWLSLVLAGALLGGSGCYRAYLIPKDQLAELNGFKANAPDDRPFRTLRSTSGEELHFDANSELLLQEGTTVVGGRFTQIQVTPSVFDGVLEKGLQPLHLDLGAIQASEVKVYNQRATTTALVGTGIVVAGVGILGLLAIATIHINPCCPF